MASRSLTDLFFMMRNNAIQSRLIYQEQNPSLREENVRKIANSNVFPPSWMHELEHAQFELANLKKKINTLDELQKKNLYRPSLDDSSSEERKIEELTREIILILGAVHKVIQVIKNEQQNGTQRERLLKQNIVRTLALALQEHTSMFRSLQNTYIEKVKSREQRLNFIDMSNITLSNIASVQNLDKNSNQNRLATDSQNVDDIDINFMKTPVRSQMENTEDVASSEKLYSDNQNIFRKDSQFSLDRMKNLNKEDCKIN